VELKSVLFASVDAHATSEEKRAQSTYGVQSSTFKGSTEAAARRNLKFEILRFERKRQEDK
jgi:hypothetical protein